MGKRLLVILDAGHGGMINGEYVTAPRKMYKHDDGTIAYEGVINRKIKDVVKDGLDKRDKLYFDVSSGHLDISLVNRVKEANKIYKKYKDFYDVLYVSIHSNAGGGTGFEVFTSPNRTKSDDYASVWAEEIQRAFPEYRFRADYSDGDPDKEAKFYVLIHTAMPAVLGEYLFFDNPKDWEYQQTDEYIQKAGKSIIDFIMRAELEV
jgi:N-acetylmuramoyl-L-alanine amidase